MIRIDGVPASEIVASMVRQGTVSFPRPRHYKSPEEAAAYREQRRAEQNECMRRLRDRRKPIYYGNPYMDWILGRRAE